MTKAMEEFSLSSHVGNLFLCISVTKFTCCEVMGINRIFTVKMM